MNESKPKLCTFTKMALSDPNRDKMAPILMDYLQPVVLARRLPRSKHTCKAVVAQWNTRNQAVINSDQYTNKLYPRPGGRCTPCTLEGVCTPVWEGGIGSKTVHFGPNQAKTRSKLSMKPGQTCQKMARASGGCRGETSPLQTVPLMACGTLFGPKSMPNLPNFEPKCGVF